MTDGWPVHLPSATVAEGQRELQRQRSLRLPIVSIIPHAERTRLLQEKKLHADNKSELVLPYNELPPKQTLVISEHDQMDPARSARQLRIALTCDSTAFTDTMDTLARTNRMAEEDKLLLNFRTACNVGNSSAAPLAVEQFKQHFVEQAANTLQRAHTIAATYGHPEFLQLVADRERQRDELTPFLQALSAQITKSATAQPIGRREGYVVGLWKIFFDAWSARVVNTDLEKDFTTASAAFGAGSKAGSSLLAASESEVSSEEDVARGAKRAKKSTSSPTQHSLLPSGIQDTICCSASVVGEGLGKAKPPRTNCAGGSLARGLPGSLGQGWEASPGL